MQSELGESMQKDLLLHIIKRDGSIRGFDAKKNQVTAIAKAAKATGEGDSEHADRLSSRVCIASI